MRRREFVTLVGGAAAWPLAARAQQPMIGFLNDLSSDAIANRLQAFRVGLSELGYIEGQNVAIEFRWAEGRYDRLPIMAADLAHRQVAAIAASATPSAMAAKGATSTIPIIFALGDDPIKFGLVKSLARPDGNATGVNFFTNAVGQKRLGLLHELVAKGVVIGFLVNPSNPNTTRDTEEAQAAAEQLGHKLITVLTGGAAGDSDYQARVAAFVQPIRFIGSPCCASAETGHVAAPPRSVMNSRRLIRLPRRQSPARPVEL